MLQAEAQASDINLVFYSSTITMMHGPIYIRLFVLYALLTIQTISIMLKGTKIGVSQLSPCITAYQKFQFSFHSLFSYK